MWTLSVLFLLHQVSLSVCADSKLVVVTRTQEEQDSFRLIPGSFESCSRRNECNRFNANLSPIASKRNRCSCSCSRQKAATFGVKNGYWQCIDNKEIRQRELSDCERIHFITETDTDLLKVLKEGESAVFDINLNTQGFVKAARFEFSYKACDGRWIPLNDTASTRELQVTKLWTHLTKNSTYKLQLDKVKRKPKDNLQGRVLKLAIARGPLQRKPFCLLFKVAGVMQCSLKHILATGTPLTTTTTTAAATADTTTTTAQVHNPFSEAVISTSHFTATKVRKSQKIPTATEIPKTTFKVTHPWATADGGDQMLHEASTQFSVPLIAGTAGIGGIVLSVAFFIVLSRCRKEKERHLSSTSLELKATKSEDPCDLYSVAEEKAPYQSLSLSPDGFTERAVYVSRYNVPEALPAINNCRAFHEVQHPGNPVGKPTEKPTSDEYDYAESSLVARKNLFKIDYPVSKEKVSNTLKDNAPYYHVLEVKEEGLQSKEASEGACGKPEDIAPCYQVLEGPNPLDSQGSSLKRDQEGAHVAHHEETDPFYHILEASTDVKQIGPSEGAGASNCGVKGPTNSLDNEEYCGYKELKSDECIFKDYQALHKYAYVTIGDPKDSSFK